MDKVCYGCSERESTVSVINDTSLKDAYLSIIKGDTLQNELPEWMTTITLCIKCHTFLCKFIKFKKKAKDVFELLKLSPLKKQKHGTSINNSEITNNVPKTVKVNSSQDTETKNNDCTLEFQTGIKIEQIDYDDIFDNQTNHDYDIDHNINNTEIDIKATKNDNIQESKVIKKRKAKKSKCKYKEVKLSEEEIIDYRNKMAAAEEYVTAKYKCADCLIALPNSFYLEDHREKKHNDTLPYKCNICQRNFLNTSTLYYHTKCHTVRYECKICFAHTLSTNKAEAHYIAMHATEIFSCESCGKQFSTEKELANHKSCVQTATSTVCGECGRTFRWKSSLSKHMETHRVRSGTVVQPRCDVCNKTFTNTRTLFHHMRTSTQHQMNQKMTADSTSPSSPRLAPRHRCPVCDRVFQWKGNLTKHYRSHLASAKGELTCAPCNRTFSSISTYKTHMTTSLSHVKIDDLKYECDHCNKKYPDKCRLRDHINYEHLKKYNYVCHLCNKSFKTGTSLQTHSASVHAASLGETLCHYCGASFKSPSQLRAHVARHSRKNTKKKTSTENKDITAV